jgi:hypothetical protein
MYNCAFCRNPLRPLTEWKGSDGCFYCSEFCAETGETDMQHLPRSSEAPTAGAPQ